MRAEAFSAPGILIWAHPDSTAVKLLHKHDVLAFASNYLLNGDSSSRVMAALVDLDYPTLNPLQR